MANMVLLMAGGFGAIIAVVVALILGGGGTLMVLKEKKRKAEAKAKAEERKRIREEALRKARDGQLDAFESITHVDDAAAKQLRAERNTKAEYNSEIRHQQSLKTRKDDLETLLNVREAKETVDVQESMEAEGAQEAVLASESASGAEPMVEEEKSKVDFKLLAGKLDAFDLEETVSAPAAVADTFTAAPTSEASADVKTVTEPAVSVKDRYVETEEDYKLTFRKELPKETEEKAASGSAFKPYHDEYEALAEAYEAKDGQGQQAAESADNVTADGDGNRNVSAPKSAEAYAALSMAAPVLTGAVEEMEGSAEPEEIEETLEANKKEEVPDPEPSEDVLAYISEEEAREETEEEKIRRAAIMAGSTAAIDAMELTDEEKAAAKEARMAEKAKYAAALAGEVDIEETIKNAKKEPETVDLLEEEEESDTEAGKGSRIFLWVLAGILMVICLLAVLYLLFGDKINFAGSNGKAKAMTEESADSMPSAENADMVQSVPVEPETELPSDGLVGSIGAPVTAINSEESSEPESDPEPAFTRFCEEPHPVEATQPSNFGTGWVISSYGETVQEFNRQEVIDFGQGEDYTQMKGVVTFRGNNFRNEPTFGDAKVTEKEFNGAEWIQNTSGLAESDGYVWTGCGWTGQPLIVEWDAETRQHMTSLYEEKRNKDGFVEVIYAALDGQIHFFDLEDGSESRDAMDIGMTFKGAGALDPRGIPLMYVGSGVYNAYGEDPRMYIINLLDCSIVYEAGPYDEIAYREWPAFDSSPVVCADADTLIWPGENGVFYTIKLNSSYNKATGELKVEPEQIAKMAYDFERSGFSEYWYGMESSVVCFEHYAYISENGGMFFCIDLNTMEVVWAQDTVDDSNSTPVFEFDEDTGRGYIYTAPSLHWTKDWISDDAGTGNVPVFKLDAITGEIIWQKDYFCYTVTDISGGVQSTPAIGRQGTNIEGLVFYPIARWEWYDDGLLVALDSETGEEVWRYEMEDYTWSSPVLTYDEAGNGYLILFDSEGFGYFMDAATGDVLDTCSLGALVEASPAMYLDKLVVGTRDGEIYCLDIE